MGKLLQKGLWKGDEVGVEMRLNREGIENAGALWEERRLYSAWSWDRHFGKGRGFR